MKNKSGIQFNIIKEEEAKNFLTYNTYYFKIKPYIRNKIINKERNSACSDLIVKYRNNFAIWNIVEVLSFSDFTKLYKMYYDKYETKGSMEKYLWSVRFLRNAAAHNNCLLNSLKIPYSKRITPSKEIINYVSKIDGISRNSRNKKMKNPVIHDFVVTLFVFYNVVTSKKIKEKTMGELKNLIDGKFIANKKFFEKNQLLLSYYDFVKKIIDHFYSLCV